MTHNCPSSTGLKGTGLLYTTDRLSETPGWGAHLEMLKTLYLKRGCLGEEGLYTRRNGSVWISWSSSVLSGLIFGPSIFWRPENKTVAQQQGKPWNLEWGLGCGPGLSILNRIGRPWTNFIFSRDMPNCQFCILTESFKSPVQFLIIEDSEWYC